MSRLVRREVSASREDSQAFPSDDHRKTMTREIVEFGRAKAAEELSIVKQAFLEFQDKIANLAIAQFIDPGIHMLAEGCAELERIVRGIKAVTFSESQALDQEHIDKELLSVIVLAMYEAYSNK